MTHSDTPFGINRRTEEVTIQEVQSSTTRDILQGVSVILQDKTISTINTILHDVSLHETIQTQLHHDSPVLLYQVIQTESEFTHKHEVLRHILTFPHCEHVVSLHETIQTQLHHDSPVLLYQVNKLWQFFNPTSFPLI